MFRKSPEGRKPRAVMNAPHIRDMSSFYLIALSWEAYISKITP